VGSAGTVNGSNRAQEKPGFPILVVEDSATSAAALIKHLSPHYTVEHHKDGQSAWDRIERNPDVGLVLTDINMPGLTGHQLLVNIRRNANNLAQNIPVIVMTAAEDTTDRHLAFVNGASDFITKPIDEIELQARVHVHYRLAQTIRELEASRQALELQATTDPLTGLRNRRSFFGVAEESLLLHRRYKRPFAVIMLDIDYFKAINDSYGHDTGDTVLKEVAQTLTAISREVDLVARIGGEEFALLLPDTNRLGAAVMAERVRKAIEGLALSSGENLLTVTVSAGMAAIESEDIESLSDLMQIADRRLYLAKSRGRNRIAVNDEGKSSFA
jgi:diguanylate cyclase (GGDEF)-like protein